MEKQIINTNEQPVQFIFNFEFPVPKLAVKAFDADEPEHVYYFRYIHHPVENVCIRFPVTPKRLCIEFVTDNPISIVSTLKSDILPRSLNVENEEAPQVKRSFKIEDVKIVMVPTLEGGTPAKIIVEGPDAGTIYLSEAAKKVIPQQQFAFVVDHEFQHTDFDDEEKTDRAAFYQFMKQGYNISQALRALVDILGRSPENVKRIIEQFKTCENFNENYS